MGDRALRRLIAHLERVAANELWPDEHVRAAARLNAVVGITAVGAGFFGSLGLGLPIDWLRPRWTATDIPPGTRYVAVTDGRILYFSQSEWTGRADAVIGIRDAQAMERVTYFPSFLQPQIEFRFAGGTSRKYQAHRRDHAELLARVMNALVERAHAGR